MNRFPLEIIHHILQYDGRIKYRNGKYMNQICKDDYRYNLLCKRTLIIRDDWYTGNFDVYRMNYNNKNHTMVIYIFENSINYLYTNTKSGTDGFYIIKNSSYTDKHCYVF